MNFLKFGICLAVAALLTVDANAQRTPKKRKDNTPPTTTNPTEGNEQQQNNNNQPPRWL